MICRISYLKIVLSAIGTCAVPAAVFTLTSCGGGSGKPCGEVQDTPAGIYREYLSELRTQDGLSFKDLTARLGQWQAVRDSVSAHIRRDTLWRSHTDTRKECLLLHDSIRMEFSRLALSRPRTYKEVLALKVRFSPYAEDGELHRSAQEIRPFFASLDSRMAYRGGKEQLLSAYRTLLSETQRKGIHGHSDLTRFIEKEDALFRAFLARLNDYDDMDLSDITRDTEKCCAEVFRAAERQEITYKEAMIYMAMRTNRRVIQNVRACLDSVQRGDIATSRQAHAFIWMILQPYASLDAFCLTLLSPGDKEALDRIATETPGAFGALRKILPSENDRLEELPGMLIEIHIATL